MAVEIAQATGSHTTIRATKEPTWSNPVTASGAKGYAINVVGGETLDNSINIYRSEAIRSDRMRNPSVRGTQRPGGTLPFELAALGTGRWLWAALTADAPTVTGSSAPYTHVFKGSDDVQLPSFTIEKGFLDLASPKYFTMTGCRIASLSLDFGIDQIVRGSMEVMGHSATMDTTSYVDGTNVTLQAAPVARPFTSVQAALSIDGAQVSVVRSMNLTINNNLYGDTGFVMGSTFRQNLLAGTRTIEGSMNLIFQDTTYYEAAMDATEFELEIVCTDDVGHTITFLLPVIQFLPNGPSPKIANDGPLEISLQYEALPDLVTENTDIKVTYVNSEAAINY